MCTWLDKHIQFKSVCKKMNSFFHRQSWKETLTFLFFILLALGFWLLQNLQLEYEIELFIPLKYKNIPIEMRLMEDYPQEIVAKVRDKGNVLINYTWLRSFLPVEVNLADIRKEGSMQVSRRTIEASISKQLLSSTSLLNIEPQTLTIEYAELQYKDVPVEIDIAVSPEPGYQISGQITVIPEKVRLYANGHLTDSVTSIKTVPAEYKKANQPKELKLKLQKIAGIQMEPDEVSVTIPVEEFTEKKMTLAVVCSDLPENYVLRSFPSSVEVVCNLPISRFRDLTESDLEIRIPFHEFQAKHTEGKIFLYLTKQPSWVMHPVITPDVIEFIIEQHHQ